MIKSVYWEDSPVRFRVDEMSDADHAELELLCKMACCVLRVNYDAVRLATHLRVEFTPSRLGVDTLYDIHPSTLAEFKQAIVIALATVQTHPSNRRSST